MFGQHESLKLCWFVENWKLYQKQNNCMFVLFS